MFLLLFCILFNHITVFSPKNILFFYSKWCSADHLLPHNKKAPGSPLCIKSVFSVHAEVYLCVYVAATLIHHSHHEMKENKRRTFPSVGLIFESQCNLTVHLRSFSIISSP